MPLGYQQRMGLPRPLFFVHIKYLHSFNTSTFINQKNTSFVFQKFFHIVVKEHTFLDAVGNNLDCHTATGHRVEILKTPVFNHP